MTIETKSGFIEVQHLVCPDCGAEYITVFRSMGHGNNYLGLVKIWLDYEEEKPRG
jgi:hypothetical protein